MHAHQHRPGRAQVAHDKGDMFSVLDRIDVEHHPETTAIMAFDFRLDRARDEMIVASPVGDEIGNRANLQSVQLRELDEVGQARHRAIIIHHLADHAGRNKAGKPRDVDGSLRMARSHEHATPARYQRKHVPRGHDVTGTLG